jgi:CheY-like chemotaxis protein
VPHTLLIADDSTTIQRVVTLMLADEDIKVVAVGNGDQALEAIGRMSPDILLADVDMPGCSGYELADRVRKAKPGQRLPVLLLAGAFDPVDRDRAIACGADGVLTKPFDPAVLIARVKELLPGHATVSSGGAAAPAPAVPVPGEAVLPHAPLPAPPIPPAAEAGVRPAAGVTARPSPEVDRYFEQLDAAFATLAQQPRPRPGAFAAGTPDDTTGGAGSPGAAAGTDAAAAPAPAVALPLADAFAALLAAEEAGFVPACAPAATGAGVPASIDVDRLAEQVAERVLARLTDQALRDTVADIVATTAERLVREEIEQIKRNIT